MTTVFAGELPQVVDDWLAERRRLGQDRYDEVWEGVYHVAPHAAPAHGDLEAQLEHRLFDRAVAAGLRPGGRFNLGRRGNFRVADIGYYRGRPGRSAYVARAVIVVEIRSPGDETDAKRGFYAAHGVEELLIVDPPSHSLAWWRRGGADFELAGRSDLLGVDDTTLTAELDWP